MELLTGKRFLALRVAIIVSVGLLIGLSFPHPFWIGLAVAAASILPAIFFSERFLYLTLLALAVSYANLSLPAPISPRIYGQTFEIEAKLVDKAGDYSVMRIDSPKALRGRKVLFYLIEPSEMGTSFKMEGQIQPLSFPRNPDLRDRSKQLELEGVIGKVSTDYVPIRSPATGIWAAIDRVRNWLIRRDKELFGTEAALSTAIIIGERADISDELYMNMRRTGTLHLLAVSGMQVGVLAAFLFFIFRLFRVPKMVILPLLGVILLLYTALVGFEASVIRAAVMSLIVAAGFVFERKAITLNSLAIAALVIVLIKPIEILSVGFQLSFAAAFALIIAAPLTKELLTFNKGSEGRERKRIVIPRFVTNWLILPISFSIFATLFTMPVLAGSFHKVTFATVLANLPLVPLVSWTLPLSLVALLFSLVWFPLGKLLGWVVYAVLYIVEKLLELLPGSLISSAGWPIVLIAALFLAGIILYTEKAKARRFVYVLGTLLLGANIAFWPWALEPQGPTLTLLDTYHGNVALLRSDGRTVLLNAGSRAEAVFSDYLASKGISRIDWVLCLSDKEGDLSGLDSLRARFQVDSIGSVIADQGNVLLRRAGRLKLPSAVLEYDLALREKPFYSVKGKAEKVVFVSESQRIDTTAINYLLDPHLRPKLKGRRMISKEAMGAIKTEVIREQGGMVIRL